MAIYHLSVKTISRSKGQNAIAAGAYRAGEMLTSEQTGEVFDYRRKSGVIFKEIILPNGLGALNRNRLWNLAELSESRCNSTVAREYELALPAELSDTARLVLAREFARHLAKVYGVAADLAVHAPGRHGDARNHHAHILTTTRVLTPSGLGSKTRVLDDRKTGEIERLREHWASMLNNALAQAGRKVEISHKNLAAQGLDRHPTIHLGPSASAMERRGEASDRGDLNRAVMEHNFHLTQAKALDIRLERLRHNQAESSAAAQAAINSGHKSGPWSLAGLAKKSFQGFMGRWGRADKAQLTREMPFPVGSAPPELSPGDPGPQSLAAPGPEALFLDKASQAASSLQAWADLVRKSQPTWVVQLKEMESLAMAGRESSARELLEEMRAQVKERLPILEITQIQDFASAQAGKVQKKNSVVPDDSELERADKIDRAARQARYELLTMRKVWDDKIEKAASHQQQEATLNKLTRKVVDMAKKNFVNLQKILSKLEKTGTDLDALMREGRADSSAMSASALLVAVDEELPAAIEAAQKRSTELWLSVRKLEGQAADRSRLAEAAGQAADLADQADGSLSQAAGLLHDLANKCQPLKARLNQRKERPEPKLESHRPRPKGQGR